MDGRAWWATVHRELDMTEAMEHARTVYNTKTNVLLLFIFYYKVNGCLLKKTWKTQRQKS